MLVRSEHLGSVVLGPAGQRLLRDDTVEGVDPLAPFGPYAADHVRRTDAFEHCPDIVVNGHYWDELEEVAAFEELVGSHGGMGGGQSHPFVMHPPDLRVAGRSTSSAPRPCTTSCAAGSPQLGQDAYSVSEPPGESVSTPRRGRQLGHVTGEVARRRGQELARADAVREEGAPVDRHRDPRLHERHRARRALGVEVPGAE